MRRRTDVSFAHAMRSGVSNSNRHVGIPADSFKDRFQVTLVADLGSGRLIVYWVDLKHYIATWIF